MSGDEDAMTIDWKRPLAAILAANSGDGVFVVAQLLERAERLTGRAGAWRTAASNWRRVAQHTRARAARTEHELALTKDDAHVLATKLHAQRGDVEYQQRRADRAVSELRAADARTAELRARVKVLERCTDLRQQELTETQTEVEQARARADAAMARVAELEGMPLLVESETWRDENRRAESAEDRVRELEAFEQSVRAMLASAAQLAAFARSFAETAEAAVHHHETRSDGGMRVPFHGDFASLPPSAVERLRWWARAARAALAQKDGEP